MHGYTSVSRFQYAKTKGWRRRPQNNGEQSVQVYGPHALQQWWQFVINILWGWGLILILILILIGDENAARGKEPLDENAARGNESMDENAARVK